MKVSKKADSTISVGEREDGVQVSSQELPNPLHQLRVVGDNQCEVVPRHVVESTARDVQLHVHAGALSSLVQFPDHSNGRQEGVLAIVWSAERERERERDHRARGESVVSRFLAGKGAQPLRLSSKDPLWWEVRVHGEAVLPELVGLQRAVHPKPLAHGRPHPLRPGHEILLDTATEGTQCVN